MNAKQMLLAAIIGILTIGTIRAEDFLTDHFMCLPGGGVYQPNEVSLDMFGYGATLDKSGNNNGAWGLGVGGNYFLTQYIGFGVESYADAFVHPYLLNGDIIARYPIPRTAISPYAYTGIGRQWSFAPQWVGNVGAGVEYRFAAKTSFFTDLRGVFPGQTLNNVLWRFGFRMVF